MIQSTVREGRAISIIQDAEIPDSFKERGQPMEWKRKKKSTEPLLSRRIKLSVVAGRMKILEIVEAVPDGKTTLGTVTATNGKRKQKESLRKQRKKYLRLLRVLRNLPESKRTQS